MNKRGTSEVKRELRNLKKDQVSIDTTTDEYSLDKLLNKKDDGHTAFQPLKHKIMIQEIFEEKNKRSHFAFITSLMKFYKNSSLYMDGTEMSEDKKSLIQDYLNNHEKPSELCFGDIEKIFDKQ